MSRNLLVYRDHLLPKSEQAFMRRQYVGFDALRPLWVGRRLEAGLDPAAFPVAAAFGGAAGLGFKHLGVVPGLTALRDLAPAAVHGQFGRGGAFGLPLARALGVPLVVTFHGGDAHKQAHWRWVPAPALQRVRMAGMMTYASAFLCVSDGVRDRLIARGVPRDLLHVHPIGVELDDAAPRMSAGESVLFIGRFVEMKGVSVLAEAVRVLRARGVTAPVVLIGDGPDRERVAQALPDVSLPGWQSQAQIKAALAQARLVCVPSVVARSGEQEGLPSVAVEAMSQSVPVVASSDAGVAGLIEDGVNGRIFATRDARALASVIEGMLADPAAALAMGRAARVTVERGFDAQHQSRGLEQMLLAARPGVRLG